MIYTPASSWLFLIVLFSNIALFATAAKHHLFVGGYQTPTIYGMTFDDALNSINITHNNTTRTENPTLALSYDARTLYSTGGSGWSSFPITSRTVIGGETVVNPQGTCNTWNGCFVLASRRPPYSVYGSLTCANEIVVRADGALMNASEVTYSSTVLASKTDAMPVDPKIYGMSFDPTYNYMYSADWSTGQIYTHKVGDDGSLNVIGVVDAPSKVSAPRSVVVHPAGKMLYVVLEAWNVLAAYKIDLKTRLPVYTGGLYNLIGGEVRAGNFHAISSAISHKGSILYATANSRSVTEPGFLTAFSLMEDGQVMSQLYQIRTPTSGGKGNNVAVAPFNEYLVALSESQGGSVNLFKWDKVKKNITKLASVGITDGVFEQEGCCGEVVWVD